MSFTITPSTSTVTFTITTMASFMTPPPGGLFTVECVGYDRHTVVNETSIVDICNRVPDKYEFGYNGQMKMNEVAGTGNWNTAQFWEYNTRTVHRQNTDPVKVPSLSPYAVFGANPILNVDINGDIFDVATNKTAKDDVKSMPNGDHSKYVTIDEAGHVGLDFGDKSPKQIKKLLDGDKGLKLLSDLINAKGENGEDLKFYYSNSVEGITDASSNGYELHDEGFFANDGDEFIKNAGGEKKVISAFFVNASRTDYGLKKDGSVGPNLRPKTGYDGQVAILKGDMSVKGQKTVTQDAIGNMPAQTRTEPYIRPVRRDAILHELKENLIRTQEKKTYIPAHDQTNNEGYTDPLPNSFIFRTGE